jgi:hypothetical protein
MTTSELADLPLGAVLTIHTDDDGLVNVTLKTGNDQWGRVGSAAPLSDSALARSVAVLNLSLTRIL